MICSQYLGGLKEQFFQHNKKYLYHINENWCFYEIKYIQFLSYINNNKQKIKCYHKAKF